MNGSLWPHGMDAYMIIDIAFDVAANEPLN